jgi:hypothetical protein
VVEIGCEGGRFLRASMHKASKGEQKAAKEAQRCQREHARESRSRHLWQDREHREAMLTRETTEEGSRIVYLTERDITPIFAVHGGAARTAREAVAERVKHASQRAWRRGLICFVCCWKLGPLPLLRDVVRYICSFLWPRRWRLERDSLVNVRSGEVRPMTLSPFGEVSWVRRAYDAGEHELWHWGEQREHICVYDLQRETWRSVTNPLLCDLHDRALRNHPSGNYGFNYLLSGDWMLAYPQFHSAEVLFSCENEMRSFDDVPFPEPQGHFVWDLSTFVSVGNCLFLMGSIRECMTYPSEVPADAMCWCCYGSNYKQLTHAYNCCVTLQLLFLNDLEYGWTSLLPPPVHYNDLPELFVSSDSMQLVARGGFERAMKAGHIEVVPIEGDWVLELRSAAAKWVLRKARLSVKPDWFEVM